jgi:carbohydrate kinase (thermoresistant glucokinase family)
MHGPRRYPLLVAGVSGSGKSTVAQDWAKRSASGLIEGDLFHSAASIAKMRAGIALEDVDRIGWLDRLVTAAQQHRGTAAPVLACSALKRSYRDRLRQGIPGLRLVLLDVPYSVALERVGSRAGHYMPPALVASQFSTLEWPIDEPHTLVLDGSRPVAELLDAIDDWLGQP